MDTTACLLRSRLVPFPGSSNQFTYPHPLGRLSINPDGSIKSRPLASEIGSWELGTLIDNKLVWTSDLYLTGAFAMLVVDL